MSRISFNERRFLNRVRKLENRIGILSELCELRAGQEAEKISEREWGPAPTGAGRTRQRSWDVGDTVPR